jgi:hypothetical protein
VLVYVDLGRQRATVYRNGVRIGVSTISSGKDGHETPTGVFTILEKDKEHHSRTYNDAPMPYQQRLTWMGVAMHAGNLPGYPASHGCVRLPMEFAKKLFTITPMGGTVVIAGGNEDPVKRVPAEVRRTEYPSARSPLTTMPSSVVAALPSGVSVSCANAGAAARLHRATIRACGRRRRARGAGRVIGINQAGRYRRLAGDPWWPDGAGSGGELRRVRTILCDHDHTMIMGLIRIINGRKRGRRGLSRVRLACLAENDLIPSVPFLQ